MLATLLGVGLLGVIVRYGWPTNLLGGGQGTQAGGTVGRQGGLVAMFPGTPGPSPIPDCSLGLAWRLVDSPNLMPQNGSVAPSSAVLPGGEPGEESEAGGNNLSDVVAVSSSDVWAVGYTYRGQSIVPLIERWNGKAWSVNYIRNVATGANSLTSVAALPQEAWAVGSYTNLQHVTQPLIEHWDGTQWAVIPAAPIDSSYAIFNGVAVLSDKDAWAVGFYSDVRGVYRTLVQRWNGKEWRTVPTPNAGNGPNVLTGVAAGAGGDVWAVGYYVGAKNRYQTLTERWDGKQWSIVDSPSPGAATNYLYDVAIAGPQDVWAVGYTFNGKGPTLPLALRWDGKQWNTSQGPPIQSSYAVLNGVSATPGAGVWVAGMYTGKNRGYSALVSRWNGAAWEPPASLGAGAASNNLSGFKAVAALSPTEAWAVGYYNLVSGISSTLTARYSDPCSAPRR